MKIHNLENFEQFLKENQQWLNLTLITVLDYCGGVFQEVELGQAGLYLYFKYSEVNFLLKIDHLFDTGGEREYMLYNMDKAGAVWIKEIESSEQLIKDTVTYLIENEEANNNEKKLQKQLMNNILSRRQTIKDLIVEHSWREKIWSGHNNSQITINFDKLTESEYESLVKFLGKES